MEILWDISLKVTELLNIKSLVEMRLEVVKKDAGKYYTNENSIFINEIKINEKIPNIKNFLHLEVIARLTAILIPSGGI